MRVLGLGVRGEGQVRVSARLYSIADGKIQNLILVWSEIVMIVTFYNTVAIFCMLTTCSSHIKISKATIFNMYDTCRRSSKVKIKNSFSQ